MICHHAEQSSTFTAPSKLALSRDYEAQRDIGSRELMIVKIVRTVAHEVVHDEAVEYGRRRAWMQQLALSPDSEAKCGTRLRHLAIDAIAQNVWHEDLPDEHAVRVISVLTPKNIYAVEQIHDSEHLGRSRAGRTTSRSRTCFPLPLF